MKLIFKIFYFLCFITWMSCSAQTSDHALNNIGKNSSKDIKVGGSFENGEFIYIDMPKEIDHVDTSAGWGQNGQKLLITGTIYQADGRTPAPGIILYYYHTDVNGLYANREGLNPKVVRHGYIRGWVKSDENGKYSIYTVRPGSYPNTSIPAHIHPTIKEPGISEYYIDEWVFDDDRLLTTAERKGMQNRGGSGVLRLLKSADLMIAEHNIILGLNIPGYPHDRSAISSSGPEIGEDVLSFTPTHIWGPDQGKRTCPVCKYGRYHGLLYFAGKDIDWNAIKDWMRFLEEQSEDRKKYLKVYFVFSEKDAKVDNLAKHLENIGTELQLKYLALTIVKDYQDEKSEINFLGLDPDYKNTIILYRNRNVVDKFLNLAATQKNFGQIARALDEGHSPFFELDAYYPDY